MNFFKNLLSSEKTGEIAHTVVKSGFGLLDNAFHTEQEKSADSKEIMAMWMRLQELQATQLSPTSISRRYISWAIIGQMIIVINTCLVNVCLGNNVIVDSVVQMSSALWLGQAFVAVIVFYYGPHVFSAIKKG